jgi:hypothetical protein
MPTARHRSIGRPEKSVYLWRMSLYGSKGTGPTAAGGALAATGSDVVFLIIAAVALLITGALLLRSAYVAGRD